MKNKNIVNCNEIIKGLNEGDIVEVIADRSLYFVIYCKLNLTVYKDSKIEISISVVLTDDIDKINLLVNIIMIYAIHILQKMVQIFLYQIEKAIL